MNYDNLKNYISENYDGVITVLKELCLIPAPSHHEEERAEYCRQWLNNNVAKGAYIDDALNVIFPINCENSNEITVFVAHTDTVFPDLEPMKYVDDGEKIYCPGVGDDTASVSVLLHTAKYFIQNNIMPEKGALFVCNSCEEGLGNLKGTRQIFKDFEGRIARFISFDCAKNNYVADKCVGSHRYEVEALTEGGHSYASFGNANAIHEISKIVEEIYKIEVPQMEGERTTYNVGEISGGTSVNTIAQSAKLLCEYRSSHKDGLAIMQEKFEHIFRQARSDKVRITVTKVGDRPCGHIDDAKVEDLRKIVMPVLEDITKEKTVFKFSSTDCNIPLSLGIPAICVGVYNGGRAHTRDEWIDKSSLRQGLEAAIRLSKRFAGVE